jgi:hypothetical protein
VQVLRPVYYQFAASRYCTRDKRINDGMMEVESCGIPMLILDTAADVSIPMRSVIIRSLKGKRQLQQVWISGWRGELQSACVLAPVQVDEICVWGAGSGNVFKENAEFPFHPNSRFLTLECMMTVASYPWAISLSFINSR